jgi:NADH-quinone oxidoreductase subunit L
MLLAIVLLPFAGFLLNAVLGRRLSKAAAAAIGCGTLVASLVLASLSVWRLAGLPAESRVIREQVFDWIASGNLDVRLTLLLDPLAAVMILVITGIGSLIHVYSSAYMHEERASEYARYFSYLNLFVSFMLLLVLAASFPVMFIGWEGVGLCSYLLIGFWYQKKSASDAGKKAFVVNRVGDYGFMLAVLLIFTRFGTLDFTEVARSVAELPPETTFGAVSLITLLLFVGATGKSAQIPLFIWLPDAMEGPTPVSALIHAATMVTAGVYMIGRNAVLFSHAPETLTIVAAIGAATAFLAATMGLVQNDIKRVLAYSTVSQLGYMVMAMGVGAYAAGIFHLYTHAFFKALLFLGAGAIIHALAGEQDLRRMGGLRNALPLTYWTFLVGAVSIAGIPGLAGFFSKDEILYRTYAGGHTALWALGLVTSLLTAIYMFRLVFLAFHGEPRREAASTTGGPPAAAPGAHHHLHDAPPAMAIALAVLAAGSVAAGYLGIPHALGGSNLFEQFLTASLGGTEVAAAAEHASTSTELILMAVSSLVAAGGIAIASFFFLRRKDAAGALAERLAGVRTLLVNKYYIDEIYDAAIVRPIRIASERGLWKIVDVKIIDGAVNGAAEVVAASGVLMRRLQTGSVRAYAASLFFGAVAILSYYLWR